MGSVNVSNVMSHIGKWDQQELAGAPTEACAGKWGAFCGYPTPDLRNKLCVVWTTPWNVAASMMWRYTSKVDDLNETDIDLKGISYIDLSVFWDVRENARIRLGVNNVFDEAPPIAGNGAGPSITRKASGRRRHFR